MAALTARQLRAFEGMRVSVALDGGERIDDCQLISAGRPGTNSLWLFVNGLDVFVPAAVVVALWEANRPTRRVA